MSSAALARRLHISSRHPTSTRTTHGRHRPPAGCSSEDWQQRRPAAAGQVTFDEAAGGGAPGVRFVPIRAMVAAAMNERDMRRQLSHFIDDIDQGRLLLPRSQRLGAAIGTGLLAAAIGLGAGGCSGSSTTTTAPTATVDPGPQPEYAAPAPTDTVVDPVPEYAAPAPTDTVVDPGPKPEYMAPDVGPEPMPPYMAPDAPGTMV